MEAPTMFRVRRFSVISTANTVAVMYFIGFLIIFVPAVLFLSIASVSITTGSGQQTTTFGPSLILLLLVPIFYGLAGWVFTALFCLLYNLTARFTGGIGLDVESRTPAAPVQPTYTPQAPPTPQQG
jgi:hypothetical protein